MLFYVILLVAAVMAGTGGLLTVFMVRETRRLYAFDQRLGLSRTELLRRFPDPAARPADQGKSNRLFEEFGLAAVRAVSPLAPFGAAERDKLARMLRTAGFRHQEAVAIYLSVKLAVALLTGAALAVAALRIEWAGQHPVVAGFLFLAGAVAGGVLPETVVRRRSAGRSQKMSGVLPSALDLLTMSLDAGLTFERALLTTAEELEPIEANLAGELRLLEAELRVGADRRAVLEDFRERTPVPGLQDMATTLLQSERYGTPLAEAMRNIAETERVQRAARIEERIQRLPVLITLPMLLLVLPGTVLLMGGPAFVQAIEAMQMTGSG